MTAVAWGKLLINLNNAVNALSGRPLREQLMQRDYRRVMAATLKEGLAILDAAGVKPAKVGSVGPRLLPLAMGSPDWLFRNVFTRERYDLAPILHDWLGTKGLIGPESAPRGNRRRR